MIKIFVYPTHCDGKHTPGVDYARLIRPMQELGKQKGFKVTVFNGQPNLDWREIAKEYDFLYLNYITNPDSFVLSTYFFVKEGKKIIFDIDDLIWDIQDDNAAYSTYAPGSEGRAVVTDIIARGCDYVTCTNDYLRRGIAQYTQKELNRIRVFPNFIDLKLYKWRSEPQDDYEIKIGYFGSSSHFNDLVDPNFIKALERIMDEDPRVRFYTIGAMIQQIKKRFGPRYTTGFGDHDIYKWVKMMPNLLKDVDFYVAPLLDMTYTKSKSGIKFLEMSSTTVPGVYQDIRQYQELVEHGKNGFLAKTEDDWYKAMKKMCSSAELRRELGHNAFATVKNYWTIQENVPRYVDFFKELTAD